MLRLVLDELVPDSCCPFVIHSFMLVFGLVVGDGDACSFLSKSSARGSWVLGFKFSLDFLAPLRRVLVVLGDVQLPLIFSIW